MGLTAGTRFGSYEVGESIGAGGMGEVYRATDTKLKRDVAVKVLPQAFVEDAERLARFTREAEILASLNHPNIATIHGLEEADGQTVIVMELVDGPTLADRIREGPIPPDEALAIARQVADALEAAHGKQIVHRDLKPANVKLRDDGTIKVLDFGISKPIDATAISGGSAVKTTPAVTETGIILGTAAYMSPEQARGKFVDERTDIWAFGCLLFEMLTGQPAFGAEDVMLTLARVLDRDTDLSSIPQSISPAVRHTIRLCLEKDPKKRIADIRDVRLALQGTFEPDLSVAAAIAAAQPPWKRASIPIASLILGGVAAALAVWVVMRPDAPAVVRFEHRHENSAGFRVQSRDVIALSPDGESLVYNAVGGMYLRSMDDIGVRLLPTTEAAGSNPFFSPDGEWVAYWNVVNGQLEKIRISGGSPVPLANTPNPQGGYWAENYIVFGAGDAIMRVSANGGPPETLIESDQETTYWDPQVLPDGSILYVDWRDQDGVIAVETPGADDKTELFAGERAVYLPTGHLVSTELASPGTLYVRSFDIESRSYGGPVPIEEEVFLAGRKHHFAVSQSGTLAFVTGSPVETAEAVLAFVSRTGNVELLDLEPAQYRGPRISPDGRQVAVEIIGENNRSSIWIYDLTGERAFRPLLGAGSNMRPLWTPDGERLTFASDRDGQWGIYWQAADGGGVAERLTTAEEGVQHWPDSWAPDMKTLVFTRIQGDLSSIQTQNIWTVTLDEQGQPQEPVVFNENNVGGASLSPNGQWIAYRSNDTALGSAGEIHVEPFPSTGAIHRVTDEGGSYPTWDSDGTELLYRRPTTGVNVPLTLGVVNVIAGQSFAWGDETEIPVPGGIAFFGFRDYDLAPEGDRLVTIVSGRSGSENAAADLPTIQIVTNWFELVKERAAAN